MDRPLRLLLLCHAFNGLAQRLHVALRARGHAVSVELDIADAVTEEAVAQHAPDVVIAPFLKRRIPERVWSRVPCWVVHPGIVGDRGPSALDWAILDGERDWGVTVLLANGEFDAGEVLAWRRFPMRDASKSSIYRREVADAAVSAVLEALGRWRDAGGRSVPAPVLPATRGRARDVCRVADRTIDWRRDDTATVLRRIRSADGAPGLPDRLFGVDLRLHDAHPATAAALRGAAAGAPGDVVARRGPALLRRTVDGGVWIGHLRTAAGADGAPSLKLAATRVFATRAAALPELAVPLERDVDEWDELHYAEHGVRGARVGWLRFDFHNGAMSERQCRRLADAIAWARGRDTQVLVLAGGDEFFSNGIHLHDIEACAYQADDSAADASMRAIEAMDDATLAILQATDRLTVAAVRGNAGAGGCFLALACDRVWMHDGVVLNPHYRNMGNLYGSEYWTYLLPRRIAQRVPAGEVERACRAIMDGRLPMGAREAVERGLADACLAPDATRFEAAALDAALALAASPEARAAPLAKARQRAADEAVRPLAAYRADELARMRRNFHGFDPSYHVARHHFVTRKPHAWTPRHLAVHRETAR